MKVAYEADLFPSNQWLIIPVKAVFLVFSVCKAWSSISQSALDGIPRCLPNCARFLIGKERCTNSATISDSTFLENFDKPVAASKKR